jgi:hypothetical protein
MNEMAPAIADAVAVLMDERDALLRQMDDMRVKLQGLDHAIAVLTTGRQDGPRLSAARSLNPLGAKQLPLTRVLLHILSDHPAGLRLSDFDYIARGMGLKIKSNSTSVMLNRLKKTGAIMHVGGRYYTLDSQLKSEPPCVAARSGDTDDEVEAREERGSSMDIG